MCGRLKMWEAAEHSVAATDQEGTGQAGPFRVGASPERVEQEQRVERDSVIHRFEGATCDRSASKSMDAGAVRSPNRWTPLPQGPQSASIDKKDGRTGYLY